MPLPDTQGVVLVYDVNRKDSFEALDLWLEEMKTELSPSEMSSVVFVVCGNKVDKGKTRLALQSLVGIWYHASVTGSVLPSEMTVLY